VKGRFHLFVERWTSSVISQWFSSVINLARDRLGGFHASVCDHLRSSGAPHSGLVDQGQESCKLRNVIAITMCPAQSFSPSRFRLSRQA